VLLLPAVECRFGDVLLAGDGLRRLSAFDPVQDRDELLRRLPLPFGIWVPFLEPRPSIATAQFWCARSIQRQMVGKLPIGAKFSYNK